MTASILPCCKNALLRTRCLLALCALALAGWLMPVHAQERGLELQYFEIVPVDSAYYVNAIARLQQKSRLAELVDAGITVPFVVEFTITRPRWYWTDEVIVQRSMDIRLSFHALTRQYRVSVGGIFRSFASYDEALTATFAVRNWMVAEHARLRGGESYNASLRMRLDLAQLSKPFQVASIGSTDWDVTTGWVRWTFLAASR